VNLFKEQSIYEQSAPQGVYGLREKRTCGWSRQRRYVGQPAELEEVYG
jgi:hypothetical protein